MKKMYKVEYMNNELCKDIWILHCISEGENDNFWTACSSVAAMIIDYSKLQSFWKRGVSLFIKYK